VARLSPGSPARRKARVARPRHLGLRPSLAASVLLHLGFLALALLAALHRPKPPEPLPPPAYAVYYESGAPDRPAEPDIQPEPTPAEPAPPPAPEPVPLPAEPPTPPAAPPQAAPLPLPPPTPPPQEQSEEGPQTHAALPSPPRPPPPRPARPQRLPGLYLPEGLRMAPALPRQAVPPRPDAAPSLDLSLGRLPSIGRASPEPEAEVRGAKVGPDWRNAFRRWLEEHKRYPEAAVLLGQEGTTRIELIVDPDGRVRSMRLLRRSGSAWLDAGTLSLFRGANLPPFPPGADPSGVIVDLTIHYVLIR